MRQGFFFFIKEAISFEGPGSLYKKEQQYLKVFRLKEVSSSFSRNTSYFTRILPYMLNFKIKRIIHTLGMSTILWYLLSEGLHSCNSS